MAGSVEFLKEPEFGAKTARAWLEPCIKGATAAGMTPVLRSRYEGSSDWLSVYGVGYTKYDLARHKQVSSGRLTACWDMGYLGKNQDMGLTHVRVSINSNHPTVGLMDRTPADPSRWARFGIGLEDFYDPNGHVLVIGMGPKSHAHIGAGWEAKALARTALRFPDKRIWYRPKPGPAPEQAIEFENKMEGMPINEALQGASLVICRHSNVAVDACIAGIPVECEDGAAYWLYRHGSRPTVPERLDFLARVCWWNWRFDEMEKAWRFLNQIGAQGV